MKFFGIVLASAAVAAHYGDPYKHGCEKDEVAAQIQGIPGKLCIPPCNSDGSCPTDVPAGVTAKPQCVLKSSTGAQYCALVCTTTGEVIAPQDAQCGKNASCKKGTDNGICTYDDAPPPPSSKHWKPVDSPTFDALGEALVVAFEPTGVTGFVGAGTNGVGPQIMKTVDSGITWKQVWPDNTTKVGFNLMLASACKDAKTAVVTGALFQTYTTDGEHFKASPTDILDASQDAKIIPGTGEFAIATTGTSFNGVATSPTGETWKNYDLGVNITLFQARYGAYPSATTWYINAGTFPTGNNTANLRHLTHKVAVNRNNGVFHFNTQDAFTLGDAPLRADPVPCSQDPTNCFAANILKTTDGGKTFTSVFKDETNNIYPNGIACASADHCISVVEGEQCQILVTRDGGKTWNVTNQDSDPACSLTDAVFVSDQEAWVTGGHLTSLDFEGRFWHTTDGGSTWTKEAVKGLYIFDIDMQSAKSGYSVALTIQSGTTLLKYAPSQ
eukprot:CAMPEP_0175144230 /NCGR_PEP_ID=MMETSP0087-20121206/13995_1 /TAXON_ID=136419 /ORGANISM="Unknown Unknown, Strain D1" /LENGTH=498 /DNA_ID=CAMNT_0016428633 /DNA_START=47 /DNA_END=1543 /DNA_ORIENTATION=+